MYIYIKVAVVLRRHNQTKIIKKSVFLFCLLDMSIICQHVHVLELRKFFLNFVLRVYYSS